MSWQKRLKKLGLTEQTASPAVQRAIKDLRQFEAGRDDTAAALENPELDDEERSQLQDTLATLTTAVQEQEGVIEYKISDWEKNKAIYEKNSQRLKDNRAAKKNNPAPDPVPDPVPAPPPAPDPAPDPVLDPVPAPPPAPDPAPDPVPDPAPKKGGGGIGFFIFAVVVGIATLGAVQLMKEK